MGQSWLLLCAPLFFASSVPGSLLWARVQKAAYSLGLQVQATETESCPCRFHCSGRVLRLSPGIHQYARPRRSTNPVHISPILQGAGVPRLHPSRLYRSVLSSARRHGTHELGDCVSCSFRRVQSRAHRGRTRDKQDLRMLCARWM